MTSWIDKRLAIIEDGEAVNDKCQEWINGGNWYEGVRNRPRHK
jgi:hypothetical protein